MKHGSIYLLDREDRPFPAVYAILYDSRGNASWWTLYVWKTATRGIHLHEYDSLPCLEHNMRGGGVNFSPTSFSVFKQFVEDPDQSHVEVANQWGETYTVRKERRGNDEIIEFIGAASPRKIVVDVDMHSGFVDFLQSLEF